MHLQESSRGGNEFVEYGAAWTIGHRPEMEDAHCVHLDIDGATNRALFGVFDGHGGSEVSEFCAKAAVSTDIMWFLDVLGPPAAGKLHSGI